MTPEAPELLASQGARLQEVIAGQPGVMRKFRRVLAFALKYLTGVFFCAGMFRILGPLSFIGAVIAVGWTYRLMQRCALKVWWHRSPEWYDGVRFETLTSTHAGLRPHLTWPTWFRGGERLLGGLGSNFMIGLQAVANSFVLTLLPGLVWFLTWQSGWNNSFHFGYEQSFVDPVRFVFGMILFALVMLYVPMAQARQAVTGEWRSFFHFRRVWRIVRGRWLSNLVLAGVHALVSIPITALTFMPYFYEKDNEAFLDLTATELMGVLLRYQFVAGFFVFPAFVFLHVLAARIYARGAREAMQSGRLEPEGFEELVAEKLHIDLPDQRREYSAPTRFILWSGSLAGRVTAGILTFLIWMAFALQIVVGQFFKYEDNLWKGWVNQPQIQMPWFDLTPKPLLEAFRAEQKEARESR